MGKPISLDYKLKPISYEKINSEFAKMRCLVMALGKNRNYSYFGKEAVDAATPTIFNIPVVAHLKRRDDGGWYVGSHDRQIVIDDDGITVNDLTLPFGIVPESCNPTYEDITETDGTVVTYLAVDIIIWEKRYPNIMQAKSQTDPDIYFGQSMEISANAYKDLDSDRNYTDITAFNFSALCLLGHDLENPEYHTEPCFTSSKVVPEYSLGDKFKSEFSAMIKEFEKLVDLENKKTFKIDSFYIDSEKARVIVQHADEIFKKLGFECYEWCVDGKEYEVTGTINKKINVEASKNWGCDIYDKDTITINSLDIEQFNTASINISSAELLLKSKNDSIQNFSLKITKETEGDKLNEKLELVSKYSIKVEDLDFNIEDLTLEELEIKLKEFSESKQTFSATFNQKRDALRNAIYVMSAGNNDIYYYLMDFDNLYAFVEKDSWDEVGGFSETHWRIGYTFDEANITAAVSGDWEEIFLMYLTAAEKATLEAEKNAFTQITADFESYKASHTTDNSIVDELVTFKNDVIKASRKSSEDEVFEKFDKSLANNLDYETLKTNCGKYEITELEDKCFSILGKTTANFAINTQKKKTLIKIPVANATPNETKNDLYDKFFEEYKTN